MTYVRILSEYLVLLAIVGTMRHGMDPLSASEDYNEPPRMGARESGAVDRLYAEPPTLRSRRRHFESPRALFLILHACKSRRDWGPLERAAQQFVQVGAELGIPGLLILLGVIGTAFRSLRRVQRRVLSRSTTRAPQLAQALEASLAGGGGSVFSVVRILPMFYTSSP